MKTYKLIISILFLTFTLLSCEEVIEIDLNSANPKFVIEGIVTNQTGPYSVKISKTIDFYKPGTYPQVAGANVIISDDKGNEEILEEITAGLYRTKSLLGVIGNTYKLKITIDNEEFQANSLLLEPMLIDSLSFEFQKATGGIGGGGMHGGSGESYMLHCHFKDKPGTKDYAILKVYKNDTILDKNFLYDGKFTDGSKVDFNRFGGRFDKGDRIRVELITVDKPSFEFFSTMNNAISDVAKGPGGFMQTGTPANPNSNISNKALGVFSAVSISTDTIVVK